MAKRHFLKSARMARYNTLRREHLTYREALEFSKMTKHVPPGGGRSSRYPPALVAIVRERRAMWDVYSQMAISKGWGDYRFRREWKILIGGLYENLSRKHKGNFFVVRDVHKKPLKTPRLNPWALYDAKYDDLPEDQRWDTPRSWRKALGTGTSFRAVNRYKVQELKKDIKFFEEKVAAGDPTGEYGWRLSGARYQLKTGEY